MRTVTQCVVKSVVVEILVQAKVLVTGLWELVPLGVVLTAVKLAMVEVLMQSVVAIAVMVPVLGVCRRSSTKHQHARPGGREQQATHHRKDSIFGTISGASV